MCELPGEIPAFRLTSPWKHATPFKTRVSVDKAMTSANWAGLYTQPSMWAGHLYRPKQDRFRLTIASGV